MSVLNQCGEEQVECPLCMEPLEVDDLNFFPCTCGYQICRFCWHRIRTDENGLCPACRKAYPEDPADFKPLSKEEVSRLKAEKRLKDQQRKQKITENRKHLANVRVVQRNLVFVVGLPMRLAEPEMLKKHEYFGKFGKIHKVVINQSTSYAGSQGPSASAYVTYQKADDALRAIQAVNNILVDGRTVKTSLGTTKYCSHFMKNQTCPKADCMYLHDLGDPEASFTKEEMQQGKHQEYEKKLHDQLISATLNRKPSVSPPAVAVPTSAISTVVALQQPTEPWPSLLTALPTALIDSVIMPVCGSVSGLVGSITHTQVLNNNNKGERESRKHTQQTNNRVTKKRLPPCEDRRAKDQQGHGQPLLLSESPQPDTLVHRNTDITSVDLIHQNHAHTELPPVNRHRPATIFEPDNNSFFSTNNFSKTNNTGSGPLSEWPINGVNGVAHMPEVLPPIHSTENWQAAFGFHQDDLIENIINAPHQIEMLNCDMMQHHQQPQQLSQPVGTCGNISVQDDDLGFDPFHETQKAFAEMMEKEEPNHHLYQPKLLAIQHNNRLSNCSKVLDGLRIGSPAPPRTHLPPPGFTSTPNHMNAFGLGIPRTGSKVLPFMQPAIAFPQHSTAPAWDWRALDPAIVTAHSQHAELYTTSPPPGFQLRQTLDSL